MTYHELEKSLADERRLSMWLEEERDRLKTENAKLRAALEEIGDGGYKCMDKNCYAGDVAQSALKCCKAVADKKEEGVMTPSGIRLIRKSG